MSAALVEDSFLPVVGRLNQASVAKRYEAYRDVDWDAADGRIDARDPRFCLPASHALGETDWYRSLPADRRAALGLDWICQQFCVGITFESCLSRGLLEFAGDLPNGSPLFRYAMHEVVEESHHSMMFHEFIRRSGRDPEGLSGVETWAQRRVARMGRSFPELFFVCVLAGEIFIDHDNRERLRAGGEQHPTLRRIMQIHVTEEARHVCFANGYLREHFPRASPLKRLVIRTIAPALFAHGEELIVQPPPSFVKRYEIPRSVLTEAFGPASKHAAMIREVLAPIQALID